MKIVHILNYFMAGVVVVGLSACSTTGQKQPTAQFSSDFGQGVGIDTSNSYALQQNSRYTDQVKRNQYGKIVNSLVAPANQTYYFTLDSNAILQNDYKALVMQANYLAAHPKAIIRLEGNADNRGSREYNVGLGWRRDQSVERFLQQHGVLHRQIKKVSYGKEHPAVIGNNEHAWRLNRRVKLVYEAK